VQAVSHAETQALDSMVDKWEKKQNENIADR